MKNKLNRGKKMTTVDRWHVLRRPFGLLAISLFAGALCYSVPAMAQPKPKKTGRLRYVKQPTVNKAQKTGTTKVAAVNGPKPKIVCEEPIHDFGEKWVGPQLIHTYTIKNEGKGTLQIKRVKPSCGCTTVGQYPDTIAPGESGEFKFSINSNKLRGRYRKLVSVLSNDPDMPNLKLQLTGFCKRHVDVTPAAANFGKISGEESQERVLRITNNTEEHLELSLDVQGDPPFKFELKEKEPGMKYELRVSTVPPMRSGRSRGTVIIKTNIEKQGALTILASALVPDRLELQPKEILISGTNIRPTAFARPIRFTNYGTKPVKIIEATINDPELKATINERTAGRAYVISVTFPEKFVMPAQGRVLTLKTDDPEQPTMLVPVRRADPTLAGQKRKPTKRPAETMVGTPVPAFSAQTIAQKPLTRDGLLGSVTVLDFFAVNCGFCKKQIPRLEKVRQAYESKGVRFVAVSQTMRKSYNDDAVKAKINELGFKGELVIDSGNKIGPLFKATSYPTMVVIGKNGKIDAVNVGNVRDLESRLPVQLNALLAGQAIPQIVNATATPTAIPNKPPSPRQAPKSQFVGQPAPAFSIKTLEGKTLSSDNFKDAPATVLNFVASNCGYCKKQVPRIEKLRASFESKGVRFVNVVETMRKPYTAEEVKKVFGAIGSKIELAHDVSNAIGKKYRANGFPTMVIVGKSGKVEAVNVGNLGDLEKRMSGQLNALIAGKAVPKFASAKRPAAAPKANSNPLIGKPAPKIALKTFEGKVVDNADFAKHPATVLNFVASNCGYCKKQSPRVDKIRSEYEGKGVRFVNVVMTMRKEFTPEEVKGIFTDKLGLKMELAHDPKNAAGGKFGVRGFPMMAVIGKSGKVEAINSGNLGDLETRLKAQLDALIAGKPLPKYKAVAKRSNTRPAQGLVGKPAPKFSMKSLEGKTVSSDDFANHPATILNFVASNCGYCKRQVPNVEKVRLKYESKGIRFVNVVMTMRQEFTPEKVKATFDGVGSKLELAHDPKNVVGKKYLAQSFPTMIVVDKKGTISAVHIGAKPNLTQELSVQLDDLIKKANGAG